MPIYYYIGQDVGGDPFVSGANINIVNSSFSQLAFNDVDNRFGVPVAGEYVTIDGGPTQYTYQHLGFGYVRGDPMQYAGFVRIDLGGGTFLTVAIDMNRDGDNLANLANGNTALRVVDLTTGVAESFPPPNCFVPGTLIRTDTGHRRIEDLRPGDRVWTLDDGPLPLLSLLRTRVPGMGRFAPVLIGTGVLDNHRPLLVSPQHRMLVSGWKAELFAGLPEVFVPAIKLVDGLRVRRVTRPVIDYMHLVLPRHSII
jgi:hypothetical protein